MDSGAVNVQNWNRGVQMWSGPSWMAPIKESNDESRRQYAACRFLEQTWYRGDGVFPCWVSPLKTCASKSRVEPEMFTAMVILDATQDVCISNALKWDILHRLRDARSAQSVHHFFVDAGRLPADADCTAIAHSLLWQSGLLTRTEADSTAERLLANTNRDGVIQVYFTDEPERSGIVDPVVCANVLHYLAISGHASRARATEQFLLNVLNTRAYQEGTRYYPSPDAFLYFYTRFVRDSVDADPVAYGALRKHVRERLGAGGGPLELAFRVAAAQSLGLAATDERHRLESAQRADGSWPADAFFRYGRRQIFFGSEALTTALALKALHARAWGRARASAHATTAGSYAG